MKMPGLACLPPISIAAAGCVLFLAAMAASAPALAQGTDEERRACTPDVMRLCREFIPSVSAITQCLVDRRAELNPDCRLVMTPPKAAPVQHATAGSKRHVATPRRAAPRPSAVARPKAVATAPRQVVRPPMNLVPATKKAAPAQRKARAGTAAVTAQAAAVAPASPPRKKPAPKPQVKPQVTPQVTPQVSPQVAAPTTP